jgi:hypothetical protein
MKEKVLGIIVLGWSVVFSSLETNHFGNNWTPQTKEEWICDITSIVLLICGIKLIRIKSK